MTDNDPVYVRYMVDEVTDAAAFYVDHLGFTLEMDALPAFADVSRGAFTCCCRGRRPRRRVP